VHRAQINNVKNITNLTTKDILPSLKPNTNKLLNMHIKRIDMYSPKNNKAKLEALYSVLNPETNSDSPSARSKGVRCLSLRHIINHKTPTGYNIKNKLILLKLAKV